MLVNKKYRDIKKVKYIHKKLDKTWEMSKANHIFKQFECSSAFNGYDLAERNLEIYLEKQKKIDKKVRQINLVLKTLLNR